jgi:SAM-dependent methyltransferase
VNARVDGPARGSLARHRRYWEELAELDALWAVLAHPDKARGRWQPAAFFRTGEEEIAALMRRAAELGRPSGRQSALDFGCGVGRLTRALAEHFTCCVGIDHSERMIARARELDDGRSTFIVNREPDLARFPDQGFDLIYSGLVLQHIPSAAVALGYIGEFVRTLRAGGLLVFQVPNRIPLGRRLQPRRRLYQLLRRLGFGPRLLYERLRLYPLLMNAVPEGAVIGTLEAAGATVLDVEVPSRTPFDDRVYYASR